jgi:hypothetical protein
LRFREGFLGERRELFRQLKQAEIEVEKERIIPSAKADGN